METRYNYFAPRTGLSYRASEQHGDPHGIWHQLHAIPRQHLRVQLSDSRQQQLSASRVICLHSRSAGRWGDGSNLPGWIPGTGSGLDSGQRNHCGEYAQLFEARCISTFPRLTRIPTRSLGTWPFSRLSPAICRHSWPTSPITVSISLDPRTLICPATYGGGARRSGKSDRTNIAFGRTAATNQYFLGFSSNYQSLQAQLTKRYSQGLAFTSAFTWGKGLGYIAGR